MDYNELDYLRNLVLTRYPRFATQLAKVGLVFSKNLEFHTVATDGENIYFDPEFFKSLTEKEKIFVVAHELLHIKYLHMYRLETQEGVLRDFELWHIAADAVINANLKKDGFEIKPGFVDMPEAAEYNAEQVYDMLLSERNKSQNQLGKQQNGQNNQQNGQANQQGQNQNGQNQNSQGQQSQGGQSAFGQEQSRQENGNRQQFSNSNQGDGEQSSNSDKENSQAGQSNSNTDQLNENGSENQAGSNGTNDFGKQLFKKTQNGLGDDHELWKKAFERKKQEEAEKEQTQKFKKQLTKLDEKKKKGEENQEQTYDSANKTKDKNENSNQKDDNKAQNESDENNAQSNSENQTQDKFNRENKGSKQGSLGNGADASSGREISDDGVVREYKADLDEFLEFNKNRVERRERARQKFERLKDNTARELTKNYNSIENLGEEKPALDWKYVLMREVNKTEYVWSQKRSIKENNYAYRMIAVEKKDESSSEVMIDVSGSVSDSMVRSFLRQLKPLLKNSKLKVGFFADRATDKFQEIKNDKDIDKLKIYRPGYGTNFDAAVKAFSNDPKVNKIVFTDGWPGEMPSKETEKINVLWLVYENRDYKPCCGKVIMVEEKQLKTIKRDEFSM